MLENVTLFRQPSTDEGTFGFLAYNGYWFYSLELPDRDNQKMISSIPLGEYICSRRYSPRFKKEVYYLKDVEGRTYVLIHSANFAGDVDKGYQSHLNGCIAIGKGRGTLVNKFGKKQRAILNSRLAISEFEKLMEYRDFKLTIKEL